MVSNLKELLRWLTFIPVPLIFGPKATFSYIDFGNGLGF